MRGFAPPRRVPPMAVHARLEPNAEPLTNKKGPMLSHRACKNNPGSDLLSHTLAHAVPSAVEGLTSVFGMGTGVTPLL